MDMAIQRDDTEERQARLDRMIEQFRAAERSALIKHGVALWMRTERQLGILPFDAPLPPNKIN